MNKEELKQYILSLATDITFEYKNQDGAICPFNSKYIVLSYGDIVVECNNIETVFTSEIFNGKSLNDICEDLKIE